MDIAPYPIDFKDLRRFIDMLEAVERIAAKLGIKIILGRDFTFRDFPHVELATKEDIDSKYYDKMCARKTSGPTVYKKR
jgi:hypothetical protein